MTRKRWLAGVTLLALGGAACSRHDAATQAPAPLAATPSSSAGAAIPVEGAPSPSVAPNPIPIPADADGDAARRITEQNLESELDRLEREIQAE